MAELWWILMFQVRLQLTLLQLAAVESYGSIAYEYEKNSYPLAMADVLWGRSSSLEFLQQIDSQATETQGVDLLSGFTLKSQMRKYFYFGNQLEPAYRQRMWQAMHDFTVSDPLTRKAQPPRKFWSRSTDDCDTPVDCRNTDNLRAMRDTSVYLMAEETGNEATRLIYKQHLERYVSTLLDIGMGEWDSPVYHGHTTAAYLNLYDFAKDPEVQQLAKEALDWLYHSAAIKYWRGSWTGPSKRTYGDSAARFFWLYFGQAPAPDEPERDWLYGITSDYLPPADVVAIAQRRFSKPIELQRTHPHYENWKPKLYGPAFYETLYISHSYQLGSLAKGTGGDWQGFSLHMANDTGGTDELTVNADQPHAIAQYENLLIWQGKTAPQIIIPDGCTKAAVDQKTAAGLTFLACHQTWIAVHRFDHGFALEMGEPQTHGSFTTFQRQVTSQARLTVDARRVDYQGSTGKRVAISFHGQGLPQIWRDGQHHRWADHDRDVSFVWQQLSFSQR
ncbi:hypothetical protein IQ260_15985 [Leptolyngbya cf. ectocarpi LEGE 11479]|uniref:Uncharacterized protein n=1 Tax=Leptolyngbya cf. ectocarpi LEGE 11479 TaxID=1828722 RepID=A0A929FA13_LEPEC|nr:hypothetical protein [Leptolyngbya ectocarpi]MBE9068152.1 hypothetical protein [Leptolyngbya cf. ectocarpi LEGE 11479]